MKKIGKFIITTEEEADQKLRSAMLENKKYYDIGITNLKADYKKRVDRVEEYYREKVEILVEQNRNLKEQYDEVVRSRAGYKSSNTILRKNKIKLEEKIKELQSDRYLKRVLPKDKTICRQQPKIKSSSVQSNIVKQMHK